MSVSEASDASLDTSEAGLPVTHCIRGFCVSGVRGRFGWANILEIFSLKEASIVKIEVLKG